MFLIQSHMSQIPGCHFCLIPCPSHNFLITITFVLKISYWDCQLYHYSSLKYPLSIGSAFSLYFSLRVYFYVEESRFTILWICLQSVFCQLHPYFIVGHAILAPELPVNWLSHTEARLDLSLIFGASTFPCWYSILL